MAEIRIGTSGWMYPHWREVLYPRGVPQRTWLEHFAVEFDTVELNVTYYRLPAASTFAGWRRRTPPGFLFAVKASRLITHLKRLANVSAELDLFLSRARLLEDRLGVILLQTAPQWPCDRPRLRDFLSALPADLHFAFEFRHLSWFDDGVYALLHEHGMALVRVSSPAYPESPATAPFCYLRLHGGEDSADYSAEALSHWGQRVLTWRQEGRDVYVYFNNDAHGYAIHNARTLREIVARGC